MSASLLVDFAQTLNYRVSVRQGSGGGGPIIGEIIDCLHANTYTNVVVQGGPSSGSFPVQIQTSDALTSGSFTDPTSGLAALPVNVLSGGLLVVNSGLWASGGISPAPPVNNAPLFCSGNVFAGAFQNPHRYVRLNLLSGAFASEISAAVVGNKRTIGSGGGFTFSPGSGVVNV
jgi:hypothetical protein